MGIFSFLFGKSEKQEVSGSPEYEEIGPLTKVEIYSGKKAAKIFADNWKRIARSCIPAVHIIASAEKEISLQQSNFGSYPCIPTDFDYPKDQMGNYMYPLAQINFRDVPKIPGYPESGYLQFYISASDELYGLDFKQPCDQIGFRVLFFEESDVKEHKTDFSFLGNLLHDNLGPVEKPLLLSFKREDEFVGLNDNRYQSKKEFHISQLGDENPLMRDEIEEAAEQDFDSSGHKIGGYAFFTQDDPRTATTRDWVLLLQIDTADNIMWGDAGVGNFFIDSTNLQNKDFSKVLYNWDCC